VVGDHKGVRRTRNYRIEVPTSLASPTTVSLNGRAVDLSEEESDARPWRIVRDGRTIFGFAALEGPAEIAFHAG